MKGMQLTSSNMGSLTSTQNQDGVLLKVNSNTSSEYIQRSTSAPFNNFNEVTNQLLLPPQKVNNASRGSIQVIRDESCKLNPDSANSRNPRIFLDPAIFSSELVIAPSSRFPSHHIKMEGLESQFDYYDEEISPS